MGNVLATDRQRRSNIKQKNYDKSKHRLETVNQREDNSIQCSLLLPPSPSDFVRQTAQYAVKMVQVGRKPSLRNRSTLTKFDYNSSNCVMNSSTTMSSPSSKHNHYSYVLSDRYPRSSSPLYSYRDSSQSSGMPYPEVKPGTCIFSTKQPVFTDLPRIRQVPRRWMCEAPQMSAVCHCHSNVSPSKVCLADDVWHTRTPFNMFGQTNKQPLFQLNNKAQHVHILERPEIIPPPMRESSTTRSLRKAKSWHDFSDNQHDESMDRARSPQTTSTDGTSLPPRSASLNLLSQSHAFSQFSHHGQPCFTVPNHTMKNFVMSETNQSNQTYREGAYISTEYIPVYNNPGYPWYAVQNLGNQVFFVPPPPGRMRPPAFSMTNLVDHSMGDMSHYSKMNSMQTWKVNMMESENSSFMSSRGLSNNSRWSSLTPPAREYSMRQPGALRDTTEGAMKSPLRSKNVSFEQPSRFRFYLKESPQVTKILLDTDDRRARGTCDRFQCDMGV